jgi:CBS domain-containing protein
MPSNLILGRVTEFLGSHSPFDLVDPSVLESLAETVEIIYYDDGNAIFEENDLPGSYCYVVRKGRVNLFKAGDDEDIFMDVCGEGDLFGIRSMLSNENYQLSAIVEKEALVYAIPVERMRTFVSDHPAIGQFFATGLASGQVVMGHKKESAILMDPGDPGLASPLNQLLSYAPEKSLLTSHPEESIQSVSNKMAGKGIDSVIITDEHAIPLGIITDTDFRNQVATGKVVPSQPVKEIMSSPVISIRSSHTLGEVALKMMNSGVHHLCITEDGTLNTPVIGVISNHDLLMFQGSSPTIIIRAINKAESKDELKRLFSEAEKIRDRYIVSEMPVHYIHEVVAVIRDAVMRKVIELVIKDSDIAGESFCWVELGSSGRKEQLLKTDLDNLIILKDVESSLKEVILKMAEQVNHFLMDCGFSQCPAGIMGHLPPMCRTEGEWNHQFEDWIYQPDQGALLHSTIFFDMRHLFGNPELVPRMKSNILNHIRKQPSFLNYLAKNATQNPPPLSFFNQFMVESSGEHKNEFDIKKRAIMPMADAARLFSLEHSFYDSVATIDRFKYVLAHETRHQEIFGDAVHGFEFLLKMRARSGFHHGDDGRFVDIGSFDNIDKKILKEIFHIIRELQKIIHVRFQLDLFR